MISRKRTSSAFSPALAQSNRCGELGLLQRLHLTSHRWSPKYYRGRSGRGRGSATSNLPSPSRPTSRRLVCDKDSNKPKGYAFCEFYDRATTESAVRNLDKHDVGGRTLRVDFAEDNTSGRERGSERGRDGPRDHRDRGGPGDRDRGKPCVRVPCECHVPCMHARPHAHD